MKRLKKQPILSCTGIFIICVCVRIFEYFVIRTDETVISENFIHKVFGIILLFVTVYGFKIKWSDIGFTGRGVFSGAGKGILLGAVCFSIAYSAECLILYIMNHNVHLEVYASGFSLTNDMQKQRGIIFIFLCIIFNLINVWMEEGVFRGLYSGILENCSLIKNILITAFFFGIWHWVMPLRDYLDGNSSVSNLLVMGIGYIILAGIMSVKWSLLYRITGSLWMGLGDHLFNNVIVTNLLHVVSDNEADNMQIVRILTGQLISFFAVLIYYRKILKPHES